MKGDKGDAGPAGAQGPMGPMGAQGPAGPAGNDATASFFAGAGLVNEGLLIPNNSTISVNLGTGPGQIPQVGANGKLPASILPDAPSAGGGAGIKVAYVKDVRPSGENGGDCIAGDWRVRVLNNLSGDTDFISVSGNAFTLAPGKYTVEATAPTYLANMHQAKLVNLTAGVDAIIGSSERNHATNSSTTASSIQGMLTIAASSTFQVQHRCFVSRELVGFGVAAGFGTPETYTQVKITKVE